MNIESGTPPEIGQDIELRIITEASVVEQLDETSALETIGKTRQERIDEIRHAREYRLQLIKEAIDAIRAALEVQPMGMAVSDYWKARARVTERRRESYVNRYEEIVQAEIEGLLNVLDLENPEHQALMVQKLNQAYFEMKQRLVIVEMETRRLMHRVHEEATGTVLRRDDRARMAYGDYSNPDLDAAEILLLGIDELRSQGLSDEAIFRKLIRRFHPDVSQDENSEDITRLLFHIYDNRGKRFFV
jgi:hypothetical protein